MVEAMTKVLEEALKERMELTTQHYRELERAKTILDRVQMTYQTKLMEYDVQATAVADLIKQLKNKKATTEDRVKMGIGRLWMLVGAWRD